MGKATHWSRDIADRLREMQGPVLVGVSGGGDSMVLFHLAATLCDVEVIACHFDHCQRGGDSSEDARFVRTAGKLCGRRVIVGRWDGAPQDASEDSCRVARRAFFGRCARRTGATALLLAHHADDQAETVLWNLLRGAGLRGASGMAADVVQRFGATRVRVMRPLLEVRREHILAWAREQGVRWREDGGNASDRFTRNRIRRQVMPLLAEASGRDPVEALARFAVLASRDAQLLAHMAREEMPACVDEAGCLRVAPWKNLHEALRLRVLGLWLGELGVDGLGVRVLEEVHEVAMGTARPARCNLPGGRQLRRQRGRLRVAKQGREG